MYALVSKIFRSVGIYDAIGVIPARRGLHTHIEIM